MILSDEVSVKALNLLASVCGQKHLVLALVDGRAGNIEWLAFFSVVFVYVFGMILWAIELYSDYKHTTREMYSPFSTKRVVMCVVFFCTMFFASLVAWKRAMFPYLWLAVAILSPVLLSLAIFGFSRQNSLPVPATFDPEKHKPSKSENTVRIVTNTMVLGLWIYSWRHLFW